MCSSISYEQIASMWAEKAYIQIAFLTFKKKKLCREPKGIQTFSATSYRPKYVEIVSMGFWHKALDMISLFTILGED